MRDKILILLGSFFAVFATAAKTYAMCPVCAIAVGAGIGATRWLGVDDSITGLWVGGLVVSMITWTIDWFERRQIRFFGRDIATVVGYYALSVVPLYYMGVASTTNSIVLIFDKLAVGVIVGSITFWAAAQWYFYLKARNGGHAYFPFQKVVMPVSTLILMSIVFYYLTK